MKCDYFEDIFKLAMAYPSPGRAVLLVSITAGSTRPAGNPLAVSGQPSQPKAQLPNYTTRKLNKGAGVMPKGMRIVDTDQSEQMAMKKAMLSSE